MILGIFDSGLGGLTVLKEILKNNSFDKIIYYGDTARVPYGDKDLNTLRKYGKDDIDFLISKGADLIVAACGTISSTVLDDISKAYDLKIIGIIDALVKGAKKATKNSKVGIIATKATCNSHIFKMKLKGYEVFEKACPKLVPLIENNMIDTKEMTKALDEYLNDFKKEHIDTLILGCTHYPLLTKQIDAYFQSQVKLINSGTVLACELNKNSYKEPIVDFYVSKDIDAFKEKANIFLDLTNLKGKYSFQKS